MVEITGGASVASKGRLPTGLRAIRAEGNRVWLEDWRSYVDWPMGLHGAIYGYAPDWWMNAVEDAARFGQTATIPNREERVVAEMLGQFYPDIEAVRFMCTGSDPCAAAAKLARAVTGREKLLVYGYHGSASAYCTPPQVSGVEKRGGTLSAEQERFYPLEWGKDPSSLSEMAAVVVEVPSENTPSNWLMNLAGVARKAGALFVLDEVKTAFRYGPGGASAHYNVQADLYCFGKTLGNGYPVSCLAGRKEIMDELTKIVHYSGTFFGEPLGLALAKATLAQLRIQPPWDHLHWMGKRLKNEWNKAFPPYEMTGHPTRPVLTSNIYQAELFKKGHITMSFPWYITTATTEDDIDSLIGAMDGY